MFRHVALGVACVLFAASVFAQTPAAAGQPGQRDKPVPKSGTAGIKGRVLAADTNAPVKRARVSLQTGNPLDSHSTTTDLDGRYEFTELPAGPYRVTASKGSFVPTEHGQEKAFASGKSVELIDGQVAEKIDILLPRGAVISGTLLDDVGDPAAGVRISVMRQQFSDGKRRLVSVGHPVETNDVGQYRLYGLPAGTYYLSATPSSANPIVPMFASASDATTYYPGTLNEVEAQRVVVRAGQERTLGDFTLVPSRLVKISGTATNAAGAPAQMVMLMSMAQMSSGNAMPNMSPTMVRPDGSFQLTNVPPGEYVLMAVSMNVGTGQQEIATQALTVAGEDITNITLMPTKGFRVTGQIVFDQQPSPSTLTPSSLMLIASPASPASMSGGMGQGKIHDDWTFEFTGVAGQRHFNFGRGLPPGWMIQSITRGQADILDKALDVTEDVDGIVITLTNRPAHLTGIVSDDHAKPVTDCSVLIFPEDAALGPPASARYLRWLRPDDKGAFRADRLPAASYMVVAVSSLEDGEESDPDLLAQLRSSATRVTLAWGESRELALKLTEFERK